MNVEKKLTVTLDEVDVKNLQVCLEFCNILEVIKHQQDRFPKGYHDYELKAAYELYDKLIDL